MKVLVTGGSGFIGSHLVDALLGASHQVANFDRTPAHFPTEATFIPGDLREPTATRRAIKVFRPETIVHLAAETHVDRSIDGPDAFISTNVVGTFNLLEAVRETPLGRDVRLIHVSTDEVFGEATHGAFTPISPYRPRSPYAASKAAADHLVQAWSATFGLESVIVNTTNNYGPRQHPEKLIPHMVLRALRELPLPIYGDGSQVRDWIYVADHVRALQLIVESDVRHGTFLVGARSERTNLYIVEGICEILDDVVPRGKGAYRDLITFVEDRPGHDRRYAVDPTSTESTFGWKPATDFEGGLETTVDWYLENRDWVDGVVGVDYSFDRIGLGSRGEEAETGRPEEQRRGASRRKSGRG